MTIIEHRFEDRQALLASLFDRISAALENDLQQSGKASLLLSGGSTPGPLYRQLSQADLPWHNISVGLVDERWVESDHQASNERLLRETLVQNRASDVGFSGMKNPAETALAGEVECNAQCATLPAPYSLSLLGMGPDGHTASLFPHAQGLARALDAQQHCAAITAIPSKVTGDYTERMTMTPWSLLQSQALVLLITGEDKWQVYQEAKNNTSVEDTPVSLFLQQEQVPVEVYWAP
ncbi:6-phosphogluconolactonase [Pseudomaricurvus alkylphenolicus]|uniref:6-phosphogluconolactonase n=1 Tax=Pseudomaricurvus alkylphenolicus TaxID=1306991 RepID=UPI00141F1963|nr:6-phosphogluconolactonase [Pseudomaricurvus alkylphenolicus]NIB43044.1 6-phosphogluconolactonase [Pseudomaricurvus alkylphenolicus]